MSKLDAEIDRAVREMLDVEPPAGLRRRVIDRITDGGVASAFRRKVWWIAAPVAAAAILILAVMAPWRSGTATRPQPGGNGIDQRLVVETTPRPPANSGPRPPLTMTRPSGPVQVVEAQPRMPRPGLIQAADATVSALTEDVNFAAVEALAGPASIAVERLAGPAQPSLRSIEPPPLQIRALEVIGLPETPRERREE